MKFLDIMIKIGMALFLLVLFNCVILSRYEIESKNEFITANNTAYQIIDKIENYKTVRGYYPSNISDIFEAKNYTFVTWRFDNKTIYQWRDNNYTYTYLQINDSSISLDFGLGWWYYFVYDENTKTIFPVD